MLGDKNQEVVQKIVIDDANLVRDGEAKAGTNDWKIGTFYMACMDTSGHGEGGVQADQAHARRDRGIKTTDDVVKTFGTRGVGGAAVAAAAVVSRPSRSDRRPIPRTRSW